MIRWFFTFFMLPIALLADPITIRSGEHETFSRLVLAIGVDTEWEVAQTEDGYLLTLNGVNDGFQTGTVFERIPRDRLMDVNQRTTNSLFLSVNCDCHADAFLWKPGQLVLDIVEGAYPDEFGGATPVVNGALQSSLRIPSRLPNLLTLPTSAASNPPLLDEATEVAQVPRSPDLVVAQTALIEGLARAASQGFLNPARQNLPDPPVPDSEIRYTEPQDFPGPPAFVGQPGIGISTAMDREFALLGNAIESEAGQQCLPADFFDFSSWGDERALHSQIANLAEGLAGEFGEEPREAQDALARLYLHFGFGAEARAVLSSDTALSQSRQVLSELAGIIDDYPGPYFLVAAQTGCLTPAALWAFYLNPTVLEDEDRNHILQQFFALPQPLRGQIAPRIAQKFISINDAVSAEKILRAAENHDVELSHDVQAIRAFVAEGINDVDGAIGVLSREANDSPRTTPESLIRLIELSLDQGRVPPEGNLLLAAAMRQEYHETAVASDLAIAEAKGRVALGQYAAALYLLDGRSDADAKHVLDLAFNTLTNAATTAVFLEFGFGAIPNDLSPTTKNNMARRMIEVGFPERALEILQGPATQEAASERRYLRAEAAVASGDFTTAIDELLGLSDERAKQLRSQAFSNMGEYEAALEASNPAADGAGGETLQFRAQAWERLTVQEDEVLSSFAQAVLTPNTIAPAETLTDRRAILAQSQESRRAIAGLLLRFDGIATSD